MEEPGTKPEDFFDFEDSKANIFRITQSMRAILICIKTKDL